MSDDNKNSASVIRTKPVDDNDVENTSADVAVGTQAEAVDYSYLRSWNFRTFYRSVLWQMILFGALSLVGPAMQDAISNLGGGGLKTPWLANLANSLNYTMGYLTTLFGGPLINKFGIKWSCMIAAVVFPLTGSAYYSTDVEGSARIGGLFRAFETAGQAVSYGINSIAGTHFPFYINAALLVLVMPCMVLLIRMVSAADVAESRETVETEEVVANKQVD